MDPLKGFQKRYLRGVAHSLKPVVFVGQKGFTQSLVDAMEEKEKKMALVGRIEKTLPCEMVALVGHMATFFRQQSDPEKRKITLPSRPGG